MSDFLFDALRRFGGDTRLGMMHAFGADPRAISAAGTDMEWMGKVLRFRPGEALPRIMPGGHFGAVSLGLGLVGPALMAHQVISGYHEGGFRGAGSALTNELAVNTAMVKYGYTNVAEMAGVMQLKPGRGGLGLANRLLTRVGMPGLGTVLGHGDLAGRYIWGNVLASGFNSALGGGVLGGVGSFAGAALGVKYSGTLTAAALGVGAAKMIGRGTYSVLKNGYNFRQARKQVNTDGDMAAFMTTGAQTMRERAVAAIQKSYINSRSALGQEAQYMSYPGRSYSSNYRGNY